MKKLDPISWIGIAVCILILGFSFGNMTTPKKLPKTSDNDSATIGDVSDGTGKVGVSGDSSSVEEGEVSAKPEMVETPQTAIIKTDRFELSLTNRGGGIDFAKLLNHDRSLEEGDKTFVNVNKSRGAPIGALSSGPKKLDTTFWSIENETDKSVTFKKVTEDGLTIEKTFKLPDHGRPYEVQMLLKITNNSGAEIKLNDTQAQYIYIGGEEPLHWKEWPMQIGLFYNYNGSSYKAHNVDYFGRKKKIMGIFGRSERAYIEFPAKNKEPIDNLSFAGVNNQFFTTLLQAKEPYDAYMWGSKYDAVLDGDTNRSIAQNIRGVELAMGLPHDLNLASGEATTLEYEMYIGPKEAELVANGEAHKYRKLILNYDQIPIFGKILGWAIKPLAGGLAWGLRSIDSVIGSWGWSIVILTILVRLLMWPVYAKSARSMKRMSKLSPMMKDLKEKYPDDPQKVQQETMKLYSKYGVNPIGGCLPMFLQMPVFLGFYRMLWGSVELRHESFMGFVEDLTMPDEMFMIGSFPVNILPILMSVASFVQMAMTPKTGDNTQRMIFMLMPAIFLVICYNFASGLALYWTVSNVFTIAQTWVMNKLPEPELKESTKVKKKKGIMSKLQDKIEQAQKMAEQQQAQKAGGTGNGKVSPGSSKKKKNDPTPQPGQSRTKLPSQKGLRHTKSKKKKRK